MVQISFSQESVNQAQTFPFSTNETHITVWNGESYSPLFIKGTNLGVAVPGTFPGQLAASRDDYARWFQQIRDAGFNTIRIYTLHFPRFYEELNRFNEANPNHPLFFFQGVWLEEELPGYDEDLYYLTDFFENEIEENVSAVHGDVSIPVRQGKAYGNYTVDTSPWMIGYIIGREIHPPEVLHTNDLHSDITSHIGTYLSIENTRASEAWLVARMDHLLTYEMDNYETQRPISASSWPTLDPLSHPFEENDYEVSASIDFKNVEIENAKAGFFASYHAYPYYPNYINRDPKYTPFQDHIGQNSYLGYLTYLNDHYDRFPLIIGEFGGSSSWGVAQYAHNGIHHGGYSELEQGQNNIRMFKNIHQAAAGGGMQFSWLDEWFKRTWITDPFDFNPGRRIIWHNATAAEQNFGLIGFKKPDKDMIVWENFGDDEPIQQLSAGADYAYLHLRLDIPEHIAEDDTVWISLDTYDADLGESILPNNQTVNNRAEFALMITNFKAELYVTQSYDLFGIWHGFSSPEQQYRSTITDGAPWNLVRWKNDIRNEEVQDIGSLKVNRLNTPPSSNDGVRLYEDRIEVRLPWSLLNFTDPSQKQVMHDDRSTPETETRTSEGIHLGIFYRNFSHETTERYSWNNWNHALDAVEFKKASYSIMQEKLPGLPGNPIAKTDFYELGIGALNTISAENGVLKNDLSLDGIPMEAVLVSPPRYGLLQLEPDGGFTYLAEKGFTGDDGFIYRVRAGANWSKPVGVSLTVEGTPVGSGFVNLYPNPTDGSFTIRSTSVIDRVELYNIMGKRVAQRNVNSKVAELSMPHNSSGVYYARIYSGNDFHLRKFVLIN